MDIDPDGPEATAFHEAGHTVTALVLGRRVRSASIKPDLGGARLGHVVWDKPAPPGSTDPGLVHWLEVVTVVALAGPLAEALHCGADPGDPREIDGARSATAMVYSDPKVQTAYLAFASAYARSIVADHWAGVEAIAAALLDRRRLSGREVRALWSGRGRTG